jgi:hypothetical protein
MKISTGGYIEKQTNDREMDREITYIYIYIMIFKAAINMGNDQPLNMATGNISTRRLAIRKLSEKKSSKAHPRSPHQHFKLGPTLW